MLSYLNDIKLIFIAHMICGVLWIVKKALKSQRFHGAYIKVFLSNTCILLYIGSFIYVYYQQMSYLADATTNQFDEDVGKCLENHPG